MLRNSLDIALNNKLQKLEEIILPMERAIIAFSGGIDSVFLAKISYDVLRNGALAATSFSFSTPEKDKKDSIESAKQIGIKHVIIETDETNIFEYAQNPENRCYFCKDHLYERLTKIAEKRNYKFILNGANVDDLGDYRPGIQAAKEWKVRSPLLEVELTKDEIRKASKELGLPLWDKPASPCLASRIPYLQQVTPEKMKMTDRAEGYLRNLGIEGNVRVRHDNGNARIEVERKYFNFISQHYVNIENHFRTIGFKSTNLDQTGYRRGSLNQDVVLMK